MGWQKRYCIVEKKKFKYYKDSKMQKPSGVFDFDKIMCLIMIDEEENDSKSKKGGAQEPKRFRIDVPECKR